MVALLTGHVGVTLREAGLSTLDILFPVGSQRQQRGRGRGAVVRAQLSAPGDDIIKVPFRPCCVSTGEDTESREVWPGQLAEGPPSGRGGGVKHSPCQGADRAFPFRFTCPHP